MNKSGLIVLSVLIASGPAHTSPPLAPPSDEELKVHLANGAEIEARLDADLTGDGLPDTAVVGRADGRILLVLAGFRESARTGYRVIGETGLPDGALAPAGLSLRRNVLVVKDATGSETVTKATYRYRFAPAEGRMRLIGLDAERYSRTGAHAPLKLSWNMLTGEHLVQYGRRARTGGKAGYDYAPPDRTLRETDGAVWMENTPMPEELVQAEVIPEDEDRD